MQWCAALPRLLAHWIKDYIETLRWGMCHNFGYKGRFEYQVVWLKPA